MTQAGFFVMNRGDLIEPEERASPERLFGRAAAFTMHTLAVYWCAVLVSPWLVGRGFSWLLPAIGISANALPADWYLQHLEIMSIIPALLLGYFAARQRHSVATWAWIFPALMLSYRVFQHYSSSSVLVVTPVATLKYFFDIRKLMATANDLSRSDPVQVLAQMTITAPFYSGIAYSLGAWISKHRLQLAKFLGIAPQDNPALEDDGSD